MILMDLKSQWWNTSAMNMLTEEMGMLVSRVDLCAVGLTYQSHLTLDKLAYATDDLYLQGRFKSLKCDESHAHIDAAGVRGAVYSGGISQVMERVSHGWYSVRALYELGVGTSLCDLGYCAAGIDEGWGML